LGRLRLANTVFGDEIVLHAVLSDEYGTVSVITSQPHRSGEDATPDFVADAMRAMGFLPLESPFAYYRAADSIAVFDLHPGNVIRRGDVLRFFDAIIYQPTGRLKEIIQRQVAP
jgi:hypothetical protein